jgi:hypothetical protein
MMFSTPKFRSTNLLYFRLGFHPGLIDKEDDHFLECHISGIDAAMYTGLRLIPVRHAGLHGDRLGLAGIPVFDLNLFAGHHDSEALAEVGVPGQRLARFQDMTADDQSSCRIMVSDFISA